MSGAIAALQSIGIKLDKYYACEIDKYSEAVSRFHYPNIIRLGDVRRVSFFGLPKIDLLVAGFPCQAFSFAGKQLNFEDPRGQLFFEVVRLLNELQPKFFILENVIMKKDIEAEINKLVGIKPVVINSALLSAQNRKRNYWIGGYNDGKVYQIGIPQPNDRGILLKNIIENGEIDRDKSFCIDANYYKGGNLEQYFDKSRRQLIFGGAIRGRYLDGDGKKLDSTVRSQAGLTEQCIELREDGKSNCLTSVQKDSLCVQVGNAGITNRRRDDAVYSIYGKNPTLMAISGGQKEPKIALEQLPRGFNKGGCFTEKSPTLSSNSWEHNNYLSKNTLYWRKLTPIECERLQTFPDDYTKYGIDNKGNQIIISNSQRYKMLGNGFTRDIISHIVSHIPTINRFKNMSQDLLGVAIWR
jgi:DNA-cytosine methyltransferase